MKTFTILPAVASLAALVALAMFAGGCDDAQEAGAMEPKASTIGQQQAEKSYEQAVFGAGCFWGVESAFRAVEGVTDTEVGFSGGHVENPTYKRVCRGDTGHAEVVRVTFDPEQVAYRDLLQVFWGIHDPTTPNRQGPDVGTQYRSAIYTLSDDQQQAARKSLTEQQKQHAKPIVTEITEAGPFYRAEDYHQQYYEKRGGGSCAF